MSGYTSAAAFLADLRLRLDAFGPEIGVMVVEGPDVGKLVRTVYARLRDAGAEISEQEWRCLVAETPDESDMCQGKDLVNAIHFWLRKQYSLPADVKPVTICRLLRASLWRTDFSGDGRWDGGFRNGRAPPVAVSCPEAQTGSYSAM
jgi:hypothetical protein